MAKRVITIKIPSETMALSTNLITAGINLKFYRQGTKITGLRLDKESRQIIIEIEEENA